MFILAFIPVAVIISILVWTILGIVISGIISLLTDYVKAYNALNKELLELKKNRARLQGVRFSYETKCVFNWDSARIANLEEKAALYEAMGAEKLNLANIYRNQAQRLRQEYINYKTSQVIAEARKIEALQRTVNGFDFWGYVNSKSIAAALRKKWVKLLGFWVGLIATIYELKDLIRELITAIDIEVKKANNTPSRCSANAPSGQTLNIIQGQIQNI